MGFAAVTKFDEADVVIGDDEALAAVVVVIVEDVTLTVVTSLLFVDVDLIVDEIDAVVLTGGAAGLNGVFCFCILYIRLGHNVTRISRPNNSFPRRKSKRQCSIIRDETYQLPLK